MARTFSGYRLSHAAEGDLQAIFAYTVRTWSLEQANRYLDEMEEALVGLAAGVRIGRGRSDIGPGYLVLIVGSHMVIYREVEAIFVVRILHAAMDAPRHLD